MEEIYVDAIRKAKLGEAKGPDGFPMKLLKICSRIFAQFLYKMYKAAARLECVPQDWYQIIIPVFNGKVFLKHPEGHRPLRLIIVFRKIHEMRLNVMLERNDSVNWISLASRHARWHWGRQRECSLVCDCAGLFLYT